ncbi:MBL fold metallo-hydrolase [Oceanobacillus zhaokaii]|uniref:MBL fold metallo-hydrolase n=1 Tax=Oceanobacillus zhaokaii TaxID=2052660 RepID=A0A345PJI6_9BACI|nr:MBL fold metallo-hydrolase [Oceanobacillus zhaokaii]AXI10166.1 MBL fold metallo-hydrolase [Oceanobacillus zhaokaii]
MLLRYFYDEKLSHASYLVGCQEKGVTVIIDPMRNITPYIQVTETEDMKIVGSLETHIHADFVTGSRELADQFGARLYLSDEGDVDWTYQNLESIDHQLLKDGDQFNIGNLVFDVMHTPGHTPESISFLLTDSGANINKPMGIFTGDFVFVGDIGRPDLLEKAAGLEGTAASGAMAMYQSLKRFKSLPDYLQVWPAHGAGSACGKALGAVPSSTVGYEKQFNWALNVEDETAFIHELLHGQSEPPTYFSIMKQVNKLGIELIKDTPVINVISSLVDIQKLLSEEQQVIDTRAPQLFAASHLPGTINIPFRQSFTNWAGWLVDYSKPLFLLASPGNIQEIQIALHSIGIDQIAGYADVEEIINTAPEASLESYENITPNETKKLIDNQEVYILDVRNQSEWNDGHIEQAQHIMLGKLPKRISELNQDKKIIVHCKTGFRSAIAVSILQSSGIHNVANMTGGYLAWKADTPVLGASHSPIFVKS